jgi:predicted metal-dependent peptidase
MDDHGAMRGDAGDVDEDAGEGQDPEFVPPTLRDPSFRAYVQHKIEGFIRTASDEFQARYDKSRGTLPGEIEEILKKINARPQVPWENILDGYISDLFEVKPLRSFRRSARRNDDLFPGKKMEAVHQIVVGTDTSGSVSSDELKLYVVHMDRIVKVLEVPIHWVQCDARVNAVVEYNDPYKMTFGVKGRGGTDFQPIIDYCRKHRIPHVVLFTDGECTEPDYHGVRVIWVFTPTTAAKRAELSKFKGRKVFLEWPKGHPAEGNIERDD